MDQNQAYRQQLIAEYRQQAVPFFAYIPWLEEKEGQNLSSTYKGPEAENNSMEIPVYDGTLMRFVREAAASELMNRNYRYVYTRHHIKSHEDERKLIRAAQLEDWELLCGIFSNYVLVGMRRGSMWNEAVSEGIFLLVLKQMKEIIEYWDRPLNAR